MAGSLKQKAKANAKAKTSKPKSSSGSSSGFTPEEPRSGKDTPVPGSSYLPDMAMPLPPSLGFVRSYATIPGLRKDKETGMT